MNNIGFNDSTGTVMAISTRPLAPGFGLEIQNIDLSAPITDSLAEMLRQAWTDAHGLLLIRNQTLTPDQHIAIGAALGHIYSEAPQNNSAIATSSHLGPHPLILFFKK